MEDVPILLFSHTPPSSAEAEKKEEEGKEECERKRLEGEAGKVVKRGTERTKEG